MRGVEELYKILTTNGIDIDAIELAESLWLSRFIPKIKIDSDIDNGVNKDSDTSILEEETFSSEIKNDSNKNIIKRKEDNKSKSKNFPLYSTNDGKEQNSLPFRTPLVRKLYKDKNLIYAFRHFKQKIISKKQIKLDEEKIAEYMIHTNFFKPFYKKSYEKRFSILFIVDISESMNIWEDFINNFIKDVENYHIFKNLNTYYMFTDENTPELYKKKVKSFKLNNNWFKSIEQNTLIFMFSDMISNSWSNGKIFSDITLWQQYFNFSIIQMLPQRLWNKTKLIDANIGKMSNPQKFSLNSKMQSSIEKMLATEEVDLDKLLKIPLLNFDEKSIEAYGRVINSLKNNRIDGAIFESEDFTGEYKFLKMENDIETENRLKIFYKYASSLSKELLELFALIPLTFPIMKLVQQNFLPESNQEHLSEILISNIINRENKVNGFFQFYKSENEEEGIREKLIKKIGAKKAFETTVKLSKIIEQQGGNFDFLSYIIDPLSIKENKEFTEIDREFARISVSVLKEMGGRYKNLANSLEDGYISAYDKNIEEDSKTEFLTNSSKNIRIVAVGVGGAGCNMINHIINEGITKIDLIAANTDLEVLNKSNASKKIQLGKKLTKGLGASMKPEIGRNSALESYEEIKDSLKGADIVFISAGLGGGTGTGATPIITQIAKEVGALTISIVTKPFTWEGKKRTGIADHGLEELKKVSDSIIIIPNDKLLEIIDENIGMKEAFKLIDNILLNTINAMSEIVLNPINSDINTDFTDVKTIMKHKGIALIGIGRAKGEKASQRAFEDAIDSPLLDRLSLYDAKGILIHFNIHPQVSLVAINDVMGTINNRMYSNAEIIFGITSNNTLEKDEVKITIVATGFETDKLAEKNLNKSISFWEDIFKEESEKEYFKKLQNFLDNEEKNGKIILPPKENWYKTFEITKFNSIKVVILGQEPYHSINQADGLAYSLLHNNKPTPSQINIFKELKDDLNIDYNGVVSLESWAKQGVLLLNSILTVEEEKPKSHHNVGWEIFTDNIIKYISENCSDIVFIFWGESAIAKTTLIDKSKHHILTSPHPSPLSSYKGFFGCKHFSKTNEILQNLNIEPIDWSLHKIENELKANDIISDITFNCKKCNTAYSLDCKELDWEQVNSSERGMGTEIEHEAEYYKTCDTCANGMSITFSSWEYPIGVEKHSDVSSQGIINLKGSCSLEFNSRENEIYDYEYDDLTENENTFYSTLEEKEEVLEEFIENLIPYSEGEYVYDSEDYSDEDDVPNDSFLISYEFDTTYLMDLIDEIQDDLNEVKFAINDNASNIINNNSLLVKKQYTIEYDGNSIYGVDKDCNVYENDNERLLYIYPSRNRNTDDDLEEKNLAISEMKDWFFDNYDDPANFLPYETKEGGYQYLFGGPYELSNVLHEKFSSEYPSEYIESTINDIENEYGSMDWEKKPNENDYYESNELSNIKEIEQKINKDFNINLLNPNSVIKVQVDGDFEGWDGETIIKLTNGEIWKQVEYCYLYHYSFMPKGTIAFSSNEYKMKIDGTNKEVVVEKLNNVIQSKIKGSFNGWDGNTIIELINGQKWKQSTYAYSYSYSYNPDVIIYQSNFGFKIKVKGNNQTVDVERVN